MAVCDTHTRPSEVSWTLFTCLDEVTTVELTRNRANEMLRALFKGVVVGVACGLGLYLIVASVVRFKFYVPYGLDFLIGFVILAVPIGIIVSVLIYLSRPGPK